MAEQTTDLTFDELRLRRLRQHCVAVQGGTAIFELTGHGAVDCLQGLLTNDVAEPGPESIIHGALLTPKGMIVVDLWVLRLPSAFVLVTALDSREDAAAIFRKSFPPRLVRVTDRTEEWITVHLYGEETFSVLDRAELPAGSGEGQLVWVSEGGGDAIYIAAVPAAGAPFQALLLTPIRDAGTLLTALQEAGAVIGDETDREVARLLAGWPRVGAEIDEKTLPQEVRFDEIGSVSYTKGCYTGQETVARVHFRGHPNRELRGLVWEGTGPLLGPEILVGEKVVGTIRTTLQLPTRRLGLAPVRREVQIGDSVTAGGREATVVELPFSEELVGD